MPVLIIHTRNLDLAYAVQLMVGGHLERHATHFRINDSKQIELSVLHEKFKIDINYLPQAFNPNKIKVFVSDMDSTLINIECIDEIADFANLKPKVAKITEKAMCGKMNFDESLLERVALLDGIDVSVLEKVYTERLRVNSGGVELINFLQQKKIKTAIVSGGFTFFSTKLKDKLKLNYQLANNLEIIDNKLTGRILGKIINAKAKAKFVESLSYNSEEIITCGDGANDLEMMKISGLSIAYHAKDKVNQQADIIIKFGNLDKIIDLFG